MQWLSAFNVRPELLADHALLYVRMCAQEAAVQFANWQQTALWRVASLCLFAISVSMLGGSVLLLVFNPLPVGMALVALVLVTLVPLAAGVACWLHAAALAAAQTATQPFAFILEQMRTDVGLMQEATQ